MENNRSYFMRRAAQERSAADTADGDRARKAHLEMARRYRELVGTVEMTLAAAPAAEHKSI
jgi:hypothetical protein